MNDLDAVLRTFFANHHVIGTVLSVLGVVFSLGHAKGYYNKSNGPK